MISAFRRYLDSWVARAFFLIMVLAFIFWGVGDVARLIRTTTWAAKVGGQTIEGFQLDDAYRRELAQVTRNLPAGQEPTQEMRDAAAREALQQLITQAALSEELQRLRSWPRTRRCASRCSPCPRSRGRTGSSIAIPSWRGCGTAT